MTDDVRQLLRSCARIVLIEAPAGTGKTHQAVELAIDTAEQLQDGQRVLLLAHTNAAKEEFTRRTKSARNLIEVSTIDAFSARILSSYSTALRLPTPLYANLGRRGEQVDFRILSKKVVELFDRSPTIARILGKKFPLIIGDEHQDADANQHLVLTRLSVAGGGRLRLFGDPMQEIFETGEPISWSALEAEADACGVLEAPKRWRLNSETRELGQWIVGVRTALKGGRNIPIAGAPQGVRILRCNQTQGDAFNQPNPQAVGKHVRRFMQGVGEDTLSVLVFPQRAVSTIESAGHFLGLNINEGADYEDAYSLLERAIACNSDAAGLSRLLLRYLREVSVGLTAADEKRLNEMFSPERLIKPPRGRLFPLAAVFAPIYSDPSLLGFFRSCRLALTVSVTKFRLRRKLCLRLVSVLCKQDGDLAADELSAAIAARKAVSSKPVRAVSTIHKAKGLEFDHVLIAFCGSSHFPDTEQKRRLLYVAMSRAMKSVTFHVPIDSPSPLLGL